MAYYMNEISPKLFDKFDNNIKSQLASNYAEQFGMRLKKTCGYRQAFEAIYGCKWYQQPYKKLLRIAKLMPATREDYKPGYRYQFSRQEKETLFYANNVEQSIFAQKVKKYYGQEGLDWIMGNRSYLGKDKRFVDEVTGDCRRIVKSHEYIASKLKDAKSEYMKRCKKDFSVAWHLSGIYSDFRNSTKDTVLMGDLGDEVLEQYMRASIKCENTNYDEEQLERLMKVVCGNIVREASTSRFYDSTTSYGRKTRKAMQNGICNMRRISEFKKLLDELDLQIKKGYFRGNRLDNKLLSLLKNVNKSDVSKQTKQDTIAGMSAQLNYDNRNRNIYTPILEAKVTE